MFCPSHDPDISHPPSPCLFARLPGWRPSLPMGESASQTPPMIADECPICLTAPPQQPCRTRCNHVFCAACIQRAFPPETAGTTGACPLCRAQVSLYSTVDAQSGVTLRVPPVPSPIGSGYLQRGEPGVASYHFLQSDEPGGGLREAYIGYDRAPAAWTLDDGSKPPEKKVFQDPHYDPATRTFTGTVRWPAPATFAGDEVWQYTMVFSESFNVIASGSLRRFGPDGDERMPARRFPQDLMYWRQTARATTIVGSAYLQGGALGLASYHFEAAAAATETPVEVCVGDDARASEDADTTSSVVQAAAVSGLGASYISYEGAPEEWRLDDGSRPAARKPFEDAAYDPATRTFTGTIRWDPPFHGDARWEYVMNFSANFDMIESGSVRSFRAADGTEGATHRFGRSGFLGSLLGPRLVYLRHSEERSEMTTLVRSLAANQ